MRERVGYLLILNLLIYATRGLAHGGVSSYLSLSGAQPPNTKSTALFSYGGFLERSPAWTVAGGAEWILMKDWGAKVEYLYYDLGSLTYRINPGITYLNIRNRVNFVNWSGIQTHFKGNVVRFGVNYHFNLAAIPIAAKF